MKRSIFRLTVLIFSLLYLGSCGTGNEKQANYTTSTDYSDLLVLFDNFNEYRQPKALDGMPDFSREAMNKKYAEFSEYMNRLKAIDPSSWPVSEQIDYLMVRANMNGYDFQHRIMHPWDKDPCFYLDQLSRLWGNNHTPDRDHIVIRFDDRKKMIPVLLEQAKTNMSDLSGVAGDLATLALRRTSDLEISLNDLRKEQTEKPEIVEEIDIILAAVKDYEAWITDNKDEMTAQAGVGKDNYDWLMKNVYMFPYTWEDCQRIVEQEDNRVITFRKLEENRNRHLPPLKPVSSQEEYKESVRKSIDYIMKFLEEEEIMTLGDYIETEGYFDSWHNFDAPWPEHHDYFFNFSHRESLMEETHEMVGHYFDGLRIRQDNRPIRGINHPYKISTGRAEGFAFGLEELLMHAGYLDERPRRSREIAYEQAAFRTVRALADIYMHSNEWTLEEAMEYAVANAPHGELLDDSPHLWYEMETTLRGVGHHMIMVVAKVQFMKVFRDRANQLGDDFVLRDFIDEYLAAGMIPQSLIRWEMTGYDDEIKELW